MLENYDLIFGPHSILEALKNTSRGDFKLYATQEAINDLRNKISGLKDRTDLSIEILSHQVIQTKAQRICEELDFKFSRVPGNIFLLAKQLNTLTIEDIYEDISKQKKLRIICLDQVTDVHNAAAVLRTASFYNVDYMIIPQRGSFKMNPNFFRTSSGASEHVKIVTVSSLTKLLKKLQEKGIVCLGLSERGERELDSSVRKEFSDKSLCMVFGAEDKGLSNAVQVALDKKYKLTPQGNVLSLNVSVACAVGMEKLFGRL